MRECLKEYGLKEIEVERVVKDVFIESFMFMLYGL